MAQSYLVVLLTLSLTSALLYQVSAFTDPSDVTVLKDLYRELNYPQQLVGCNSSRGDPCEESWKGISCNGSSVIFIQINGLELNGRLGDQLFNLFHLKQLNVSSNHIYGEISASLPPNATYIDLSFNDFSGNIPYSLTSMKYLRHLNLSHNSLSGPVGNVFTSLQNLKQMDLSNNNFTGDLPTSFQDLKNLTALNLPNSSYSKDLFTEFEEQEENEQQQTPQPDQEQQQPPQPEQEQQPQPQPNEEQQQHNGDEVADAGGNDGEEGNGENDGEEGNGEEDDEDEEEDDEDEEDEEEDEDETLERDNFCRLDEPKVYGDTRRNRPFRND